MGRKGNVVALIDPKFVMDGPNEQDALEKYYRAQGMPVFHADPSELCLKGDEVLYEGTPIDICYRDYELRDIIGLEEEGVDVSPLKHLFKTNRMVSSMAGDFDHKSGFEILTDPNWAKHFTPDQQEVFQRHVLWTRIVADRRTTLPDGELGSLLEFARRDQELLVIKPNRSYGGDGVLLGPSTSTVDWEAALQGALASDDEGEGQWVVQRLARIPVSEFPVFGAEGEVCNEPFYTVMGLAPTRYGLSILGRASQKQVVNVAQRGGMCGILVGRPPGRLRGPGAPVRLG